MSSVLRENSMSIFVYHMVFLIAETVPEKSFKDKAQNVGF